MKKLLTILTFSVLLVFFIFGLGACDDEKDLQANNISFKTLTVKGDTVYGKVSNETTEFSFLEEISCNDSTQYVVSLDSYGVHTVVTKTVPLIEGNNVFYVIETNEDNNITTYTVTIRRRPLYLVRFDLVDATTESQYNAEYLQFVEEDSLASYPEGVPIRKGYTFEKWQFDFSMPINNNIVITASWIPNIYKVNYDLNGGTVEISKIKEQVVVYGEEFTPSSIIPIRTGYDFDGWYYVENKIEKGKWKIAENVVLEAKWNAIFKLEGNTLTGFTTYGIMHYTNNLVIPESIDGVTIKSIGTEAFMYRSNITHISIPNTVTSILRGAFQYCKSLESITIPSSVTYINRAFYGCTSLTSAIFENPNGWIGRYQQYGYTNDEVLDSSELKNPSRAAQILKMLYYDWGLWRLSE